MTLEYLLRHINVIYSIIIAKEELYPRQSKIFYNQTYKDIKEWEHCESIQLGTKHPLGLSVIHWTV